MPEMKDYNVTSYGVFDAGVTSTKNFGSQVDTIKTDVEAAKTTLNDSGVLMGPFQDECLRVLGTINTDFSTISDSLTTMANHLITTSGNYQAGDTSASNTVSSTMTSTSSADAISSGNMTSYNFNGKTFNVVNTKISLDDYTAYVNEKGLTQNKGLLGGDCMLLAQYYASDMLAGKYTSRSDMANCKGGPAVRMNEVMSTPNKDEALQYMYQELNEGHPVTLQATQVNTKKDGSRHIVTVVGYTSDVTSASDLNADNILVLDNVDGKIQTLGQARSEGGHERDLFAQGGKYQVKGPTENFLNSIA